MLRRSKSVLFIQHGDSDRPGLFADALEREGVDVRIARPDKGEILPGNARGFDGLALGGGAQSACQTEKFPYLKTELALVRDAVHRDMPVLGLCLGGQLIAAALGAAVRRAPQREIGFFPVALMPAAGQDPIWRDVPATFATAHWHGDIFDIPDGGTLLASSALTPNQLFRYGRKVYGLQFHLEMTEEIFEEMLAGSDEELLRAGADPALLRDEAKRILPGLRETAETVFRRWAAML